MPDTTAKGTLWLIFAEIIFLISSYFIHIFLGRTLGPENYGVLGIVLSLMIIIQIFLQKGLPQAISKFIAEHKDKQPGIIKSAAKVQFLLALFFTLVYFIFADYLAIFLKSPQIVKYIRFSSLIILPTAFYSLYATGIFNGNKEFKKQAILRIVSSLVKLFLVLVFVYFGFEIYGIISAYVIAILVAVILGVIMYKQNSGEGEFPIRKIFWFSAPIIIFSFFVRLFRYLDLFLVKNILIENALVGYYTAALNVADVLLFVFAAVSFTILPNISETVSRKNHTKTKSQINDVFRYTIMLIFPITILIHVTATEIITFLYSSAYYMAGPILSLLVFKNMFLALFIISCAIITGSGRPKVSLYLSTIILSVAITLNYILVPILGVKGAAISGIIAGFVGFTISVMYIYKKFNAFCSWKSCMKILIAGLCLYILIKQVAFFGLMLFVIYILSFIFYFLFLYLLKEFTKKDFEIFKIRKIR